MRGQDSTHNQDAPLASQRCVLSSWTCSQVLGNEQGRSPATWRALGFDTGELALLAPYVATIAQV